MPNTSQLTTQNPWPGLRAFTEKDREFFFGRERETSELLDLVQRSSVVVLYGQSGLGKTSLLQAGLLPDLRRLNFLPFRVRFDHGENALSLAQQVKNELCAALDRSQCTAPKPGPDETLWEYFHRRDVDFWGPRNRLLTPVILLDQFEEVFTLGQRDDAAAKRVTQFSAELESVLEHRPSEIVRSRLESHPDDALRYDLQRQAVKFLISLREDFLPDLDPWRERMPSLLANRMRLERMTGAQALDVVQRGGRDLLDAGVARDIVDFVSKSQREQSVRAMEQRDVEPALLSVVCDELNQRRIDQGKSRISTDLLTDEREEIIQNFYERAFDEIDPRVRNWVEDNLLTASGYRNRAALEDALHLGLPKTAFDQLVDARILHREERSGVVWLELTHDLLSDPASRSRTLRDQRRQAEQAKVQAEAAAKREAALRRDLLKSRALTTVFGFLLIGTAVALYVAITASRAARQKESQRAESYQTALNMTENLSLEIGGGNWVPAATVLHNIADAKQAWENLTKQAPAEQQSRLSLAHARSLTKAADSLYQIGHFEEGLASTQEALKLLDAASTTQKPGDTDRLAIAEARYEEGTGLLAAGHLSSAKASFQDALNVSSASSPTALKQDFARVFVLSQLGLGEAEIAKLDLAAAQPHFQAALDFAMSYKSDSSEADEVLSWQVLANRGLGLSRWNEEEAEKYFSVAANILGTPSSAGGPKTLVARDPTSPRWKMMVADLTFRQGQSYLQLGRYEDSKKYFEESEDAARDLCSRDCPSALDLNSQPSSTKEADDNWLWRVLLLQSLKGLGLVHYYLGEWDSSQSVLQEAEAISKKLNLQQPSWTRAANLHAAVEINIGDVLKWKYKPYTSPSTAPVSFSFNSETKPERLFDLADSNYQEAENILMGDKYSAIEDPEFARMAALALLDQGSLRVLKAAACRSNVTNLCFGGKGNKNYSREQFVGMADQLDKDALNEYSAAFQKLQPILEIAKDSLQTVTSESFVYSYQGDAYNDLKQYPNAISAYRKSVASIERLAQLENIPTNYSRLSSAHLSLGDTYLAANDPPKANAEYRDALKAITIALNRSPVEKRSPLLGTESVIYDRFADLAFKRGDLKESLDNLEKGIKSDWEALNGDYADVWLNSNLKINRTGSGTSLDSIEKAIKAPPSTGSPQQPLLNAKEQRDALARIAQLRKDSDPALLLEHYSLAISHNSSDNKQASSQGAAGTPKPLLPGAWRVLIGSERVEAQQQLLAAVKNVKANQVQELRVLPLGFYDNAPLYEAKIALAEGGTGVVAFVRLKNDSVALDGSMDQIRKINVISPPRLDSPERAIAYVRFVIEQLHVDGAGRVQLIDQAGDLDWLPSATEPQRTGVAANMQPLVLSASADGDWQAIGSVLVGGTLERCSFHLSRDGNVSIAQENRTDSSLPVLVDMFYEGVRVPSTIEVLQGIVKRDASDLNVTKTLAALYFSAKRWKEGAETEKKVVELLVQQNSKNGNQSKDDLDAAYYSLAVDQLLEHDFAGAMASGDAEKKLGVAEAKADSVRAYALLLNGNAKEAETIFVSDVGKTVGTTPWIQSVEDDFAYLKTQNLDNPDFPHILDLMNMEQARQRLPRLQQALKANPKDEDALGALPDVYSTLKRWNDAVEAQENWIAYVQSEVKDEAVRNKTLVGAYTGLSWYQLFARDFAGALKSAEAGRKIDPSDLFPDTNRAHALLFLGRTKEAEAIYTGNRGKKLSPDDNRTWEQAILDDFSDFDKENLTNPEIARIRKLLSPDSK